MIVRPPPDRATARSDRLTRCTPVHRFSPVSAPEAFVPIDTQIAVLSNVHDNAHALHTVLNKLSQHAIQRIYMLDNHLIDDNTPLKT